MSEERSKIMDTLIAQDADLIDQAAPDRLRAWLDADGQGWGQHEGDVSELLAELAKWKALAETLAGALDEIVRDCEADYPPSHGAIKHFARQALTSYKEQRDD